MRAPVWFLAALLGAALFTSCDSSSSSEALRLFTEADAYTADATVTLTLANDTSDEVFVHPELCGLFPQTRTEDGWDAAPPFDRLDFLCTQVVRELADGERVTVTFSLTELDEPAGTYRFTYGTSMGQVTSNTFQVTN
ncbi:MAG: hypothetical protein AAFX41_09665 [Bacteroidota bacterium]